MRGYLQDLSAAALLIDAASVSATTKRGGDGNLSKKSSDKAKIKVPPQPPQAQLRPPPTATAACSREAAEDDEKGKKGVRLPPPSKPLPPSVPTKLHEEQPPPQQQPSGLSVGRWRNPLSRQELRSLTAGTGVEEQRTLAALRDIEACLEEGGVAVGGPSDEIGQAVVVKATSAEERRGADSATVATVTGGGAPSVVTAAAVAALPPKLASALGLSDKKEASRCAVGVDGRACVDDERAVTRARDNNEGGGDACFSKGSNCKEDSMRRGSGTDERGIGRCWYPSVDVVRQARASVEFRVARREHLEKLERAAHAFGIACGNTITLNPASASASAAAAAAPAEGVTVPTVEDLPVSDTTPLSSAGKEDSPTALLLSSRAAAVSTGLRAWLANGGAVTDLFRARVDADASEEREEVDAAAKSGPAEAMARVVRENQARAEAARADVMNPPRVGSSLLPARLRVKGGRGERAAEKGGYGDGGDESKFGQVLDSFEAEATASVATNPGAADAAAEARPVNSLNAAHALLDIHAVRIRELKPLMTRAIRRRRLALRRRWEELGDEYARVRNVWQTDAARWEEKMEEEEAKEALAGGAAASSGGAGGGVGGGSSIGLGGIGGEEGDVGRMERRGGGRRLSDVVRSDYEEAEVVKKFEDKHKEEERIRKGAGDVPAMLTAMERHQLPEYVDASNARGTTDGQPARCAGFSPEEACPVSCNCPAVVEVERKRMNLWTDMEKCIFLDKFIQHPKNFMRISSFLPRKSSEDAVQFYYDSKTSIDYKALLKEAVNRSKVLPLVCWFISI